MSRILEKFADLKRQNRMAFMPFVTAGDPDMQMTLALVGELSSRGVDLIEVGFPYSDPIADGPVIQASYTRALQKHLHVRDIFEAFRNLRAENEAKAERGKGRAKNGKQRSDAETRGREDTGTGGGSASPRLPLSASSSKPSTLPPLVAMVAYAIVFRTGPERFLQQAEEAGFSGLIVPDLPGDEAGELAELARWRGLDLIELISPLTPPARVDRILASCSGFVYCVSVAGTTGVRDKLPDQLRDQLKWLRTKTKLPLAVGFGISRPEQIEPLRGRADGVIVGSAIVRELESLSEGSAARDAVVERVGDFAASMVAAAHASGDGKS